MSQTSSVTLLAPSPNAAIQVGDITLSAADWCRASEELRKLLPLSSQPKRLAVCAESSLDLLLLASACLAAGWTFVPISHRWPLPQRLELAKRAGADYCWPEHGFTTDDGLPLLVIEHPLIGLALNGELNTERSSASRIARWLQPGSQFDAHALPAIAAQPALEATVLMTSGSSGMPKAVLHPLSSHLSAAAFCNPILELSAANCWLLSLPMFHAAGYGLFIRCLSSGARLAIAEPKLPLFEQLQQSAASHCSLVATQLQRLLELSTFHADYLPLRHIMLGGGPVADTLLQQASQRGFKLYLGFGMTETAAAIALSPVTADGGIDISNNNRISLGDDGQIGVRGPQLANAYVEGDYRKALVAKDGWFATGDLGRVENGRLFVVGRVDNRFISGGENVQPEMVEQALKQLPEIEQVLVVPIADDEFGQRPVAFVRWYQQLDDSAIQLFLAAHLPKLMWPVRWLDWPSEMDAVKPNRTALKQLAERLVD
ncbi:AMP-binding protein [Neiella marina]|uniref:AMP-binding protein n=1 Tax=Neiella marina TaxID=508461 RepID=UPI000B3CEC6A|nr:AMP-binding protein [Neiella marina]